MKFETFNFVTMLLTAFLVGLILRPTLLAMGVPSHLTIVGNCIAGVIIAIFWPPIVTERTDKQ